MFHFDWGEKEKKEKDRVKREIKKEQRKRVYFSMENLNMASR